MADEKKKEPVKDPQRNDKSTISMSGQQYGAASEKSRQPQRGKPQGSAKK